MKLISWSQSPSSLCGAQEFPDSHPKENDFSGDKYHCHRNQRPIIIIPAIQNVGILPRQKRHILLFPFVEIATHHDIKKILSGLVSNTQPGYGNDGFGGTTLSVTCIRTVTYNSSYWRKIMLEKLNDTWTLDNWGNSPQTRLYIIDSH